MNLLQLLFGKKGFKRLDTVSVDKITSDWQSVQTLMQGKSPSHLKQALISADRCLDHALKSVVAGETMGERLKNANTKFDRNLYDKIWKAHKIRNSLVHEAGYEPPYFMINDAVETFRKALGVLGIKL